MKRILVLLLLNILQSATIRAQGITLTALQKTTKSITEAARNAGLEVSAITDSLPANISLQDINTAKWRRWKTHFITELDTAAPVSYTVSLPVLSAGIDEAIIINGRITACKTVYDSTIERIFPLPILSAKKESGSWIFEETDLSDLPPGINGLVTDAEITVTPHGESSSVHVSADFNVRNAASSPVKSMPIYLGHPLLLHSIREADRPVRYVPHTGEIHGQPAARYDVLLNHPLDPGEETVFHFDYTASYAYHHLGRKPVGFNGDRGFMLMECSWFPRFSPDIAVTFPYSITINVPASMKGASAGRLVGTRHEKECSVYQYRTDQPRYLWFVWGKYSVYTAETKKMPLEIWAPETIDPGPMGAIAGEIIDLFSTFLPAADLDMQRIIAVTRFGGYGPTGTLLLQDPYFSDRACRDAETIDIIAHELTHSWIGSLNPPSGQYSDFLSEGMAVFMGARAVAKIKDAKTVKTHWQSIARNYQDACHRAVPPVEMKEKTKFSDNRLYRAVTYFKSAFFFRELEFLVTEDIFFTTLKNILTSAKNRPFTLNNLTEDVQQRSHASLRDLKKLYLDSAELPDYRLIAASDKQRNGRMLIENLGVSSSTPVEIAAYDSAGTETRRVQVTLGAVKTADIEFGDTENISYFVIDPDVRILQREVRNDIYPDYLASMAIKQAIANVIHRIFDAMNRHDSTYFEEHIASETFIDTKLRNRMINMAKTLPIKIKDPSIPEVFMTGAGKAEAECTVEIHMNSDTTSGRAAFRFVREGNIWKCSMLRVTLDQ